MLAGVIVMMTVMGDVRKFSAVVGDFLEKQCYKL
jgi:hypothetical protein